MVELFEAEADPEAGDPVDLGGDPRVRAEAGGEFAADEVHEAVVRQRLDAVFRFGGQQADALVRRQVGEQSWPALRRGGEKCRADQIHRGSRQLRGLTRPRFGLEVAEQAQPGGRRQDDKRCQQQEGAREQRARDHRSSAPSGTKT